MKKGFAITLLLLVVLAVIMAATCPKPADHREAIKEAFTEAIDEKVGSSDDIVQGLIKFLGKFAIGTGSQIAIDRMVTVDDYYLFSIGRIEFQGKERIVSVGVMNHIFTVDKDDILKELKKYGI